MKIWYVIIDRFCMKGRKWRLYVYENRCWQERMKRDVVGRIDYRNGEIEEIIEGLIKNLKTRSNELNIN